MDTEMTKEGGKRNMWKREKGGKGNDLVNYEQRKEVKWWCCRENVRVCVKKSILN